jgi:cytoskeleton protein RodZ
MGERNPEGHATMNTPSTETDKNEEQTQVSDSDARLEAQIRLGERLSQARQTKGAGINEVSEQLRIRKNYLKALESGNWSALPEEVYVMGFLRQYAALLGIDVNQEIETLKSGEYHLTKPFTMPDPPIAMSRTWALAAGACFFLLIILFNVVDDGRKEKPQQSVTTAAPGNAAKQEQAAANSPPALVPSEAIPTAENTASAGQAPAEPAPPSSPAATPATPPAPGSESETNNPGRTTAVASAASPAQATQHPAGNHVFRLTAVDDDVWLQLRDPDNKLLKDVLLRSGQSMEINAATDYLLLTAGNPLHLRLSVDGVLVADTGTLGEKDKVLHKYRLQAPATPIGSGQ